MASKSTMFEDERPACNRRGTDRPARASREAKEGLESCCLRSPRVCPELKRHGSRLTDVRRNRIRHSRRSNAIGNCWLVEPDAEPEIPVDEDSDLRERVNAAWKNGKVAEFYSLLLDEAHPRLTRYLRNHGRFDDDEVEDCISAGLERFHGRAHENPGEISDPYNYFYTIVVRAAVDIQRQQEQDVEVRDIASDVAGYEFRTTSDGSRVEPTQPVSSYTETKVSEVWAATMLEEAVEGVEAIHPWSVPVVRRAITRLSPAQRRVIAFLSERELDYTKNDLSALCREGADALGIRPDAFRKTKQRAYEALRRLIPEVIRELGINLPRRLEESIFTERPQDLGEDED